MLKDPEDLLRRRKLSSFMTTGAAPTPTASTTTTTPPITPPTQHQALHHHHHQHHLNMMMASALNMSATPTSAPPPLPPILNVPQTAALALTASTASAGSVATSSGHLPAHMAAAAAAAAAAIEQLSQQHQQQQHQQQLQQQQQQQQQQQHLQQQPHQAPMLPINIPQPPQPAAAHHQHHTHPQNSSTTTSSRPSSTSVAAANSLMPATSASLVQDHYSLRWNNHQNHILRAFDALLQTKTLVDVTLVSADSSIRAHKMVLSACSPFFQRVFADTPCKHPVIVLKDFPGWVVQAIVDFMYRGEISVQQERLQSLIQAGESLQIRGLVESSVPEHTPTPAASPDDFAMALDSSMLSSELERCSSFDEDSPSMVTAGSKVILPSRLFGASASRRERKRERESISRDLDSDHEMHSDLSTSPMPRRKQARPRRRSSDMPPEMPSKPTTPECRDTHDDQHQDDEGSDQPLSLEKEKPQTPPSINEELPLDPEKTVIKREMLDSMDEPESGGDAANEADPTRGEDSGEGEKSREDPEAKHRKTPNFPREPRCSSARDEEQEHEADDEDADDHDNGQEHEDEELLDSSMQMRRRRSLNDGALSDGPEDLCTTKKDNDTSGVHSMSDSEGSPSNNNNNSKLNNNNRIVLSLKDIRQLNKPSSSSTPNSASSMNPFGASSLRDLRMDRSASAAEQQCKMEALEAQMHAAAAAAACAAANGENPFQHMEHQMDLSLAAAAAAAAVSHQQSRERDHAMQREQREFHQQQQNAYANSLLGQMAGMPGMPGHFGPGGGCGGGPPSGPAPHERLEESMNRLSKDFPPSSPLSLSGHYNPGPDGGPPHPPSPLPFPGMSSALNLTPPHMFGLDSPLGLFPPGIDPGKLYNPLMEMSDPRGMGPDPTPFLKKKMPRPKGQHSAPRGGPPRSWTNAELTEALQHVWNKKMTTSQASRIFGIPYNSLLMYVRGKYGKSLKLEQLRKDCISGPPLELLQMGMSGSSSGKNSNKEGGNSSGGSGGNGGSGSNTNNGEKNGSGSSSSGGSGGNASNPSSEGRESRQKSDQHRGGGSSSADMDLSGPPPLPGMGSLGSSGPRSASSEPDLLGGPNSLFNPFPQGFYPDFASGFPGLPLGMLNLLPPSERHQHAAMAAAMHHMSMDEDCKSVGSKQSSSMDEEFGPNPLMGGGMQPLSLSREDAAVARRASDLLLAGLPQGPPPSGAGAGSSGASGGVGTHD